MVIPSFQLVLRSQNYGTQGQSKGKDHLQITSLENFFPFDRLGAIFCKIVLQKKDPQENSSKMYFPLTDRARCSLTNIFKGHLQRSFSQFFGTFGQEFSVKNILRHHSLKTDLSKNRAESVKRGKNFFNSSFLSRLTGLASHVKRGNCNIKIDRNANSNKELQNFLDNSSHSKISPVADGKDSKST